jgi:hypothetical protein
MFITVLRYENVMKLSDMNNERGIREKEHMSGDLEKVHTVHCYYYEKRDSLD